MQNHDDNVVFSNCHTYKNYSENILHNCGKLCHSEEVHSLKKANYNLSEYMMFVLASS